MRAVQERAATHGEGTHPARRMPAEEGVWVFIFGDMAVFAVLFITFVVSRNADVDLFAASQAKLDQNYGATNTLLLLLSSLLVVMAVRSLRERRGRADVYIAGAAACGIAFSTLKVLEYLEKTDAGITPATDDFFMYYFILTGLHWFHLALGLVLLGVMFHLSRKAELTTAQSSFAEGAGCFWHMVDLLWIVLFPLLYLVH